MRRPLPVLVLLLLTFGAVASAGTQARIDVSGTYASNWDDVTLVQEGDRITGTYVCCGRGAIEGRIEGRIVRYRWREPRGAVDAVGEGVWKVEKDGRLVGTWGNGQSTDDGGPWTLVPKQQTSRIAQ